VLVLVVLCVGPAAVVELSECWLVSADTHPLTPVTTKLHPNNPPVLPSPPCATHTRNPPPPRRRTARTTLSA
jgi:hypothetical protein